MVTGTTSQPNPVAPGSAPTADLVFGRYQIIRRLAVGGMGEVFLARQSGVAGFDRLVILKSLLPDLAAQEDFVNQFLDEARVAATLNHPNIVSIYEVGLWNGTYFIAMEYIRGDNLSRLQRVAERANKRIPADVAAFIIHDAAHALDHAHKAHDLEGQALHIVHRDVSPQNIMVRTDGVTKVVDFGIAKAANRSSRTATGLLKGKVQYMAPEQVSGAELDGRADQFALGVVLWEMIAGKKLFQGANDIDILRAVLQAPIPPLTSVVLDTPPELSRTVDRMLARERDHRFPTLLEAAADLKKFLELTGLKNAQERTAEYVRDLLGEEISAKTLDLTPSGANNFVINLSQSQPPSTSPTAMSQGGSGRKKATIGIAAGVGGSLLLGVVAFAFLFMPAPAAEAPLQPQRNNDRATITVNSTPVGALVKVDGKEVGKSPALVDELDPAAEHLVEVSAPGFATQSLTQKVVAGKTSMVNLALVELPAALTLTSEPSGADVKEKGQLLGKTPLELTGLKAGEHLFTFAFEKGKDRWGSQKAVKLAPGSSSSEAIKLVKIAKSQSGGKDPGATPPREAAVAEAATGFLTLDTKPWAKLYVDGKYVDSTPISKLELSAGSHSVRLVNEAAGVDTTKSVKIKSGENLKQSWALK